MPKTVSEFVVMMDERLWFRMLVCFLPALVVAKLASYSDTGSIMNKTSTAALVIGVGTYLLWGRARGFISRQGEELAEDSENELEQDGVGAVTADAVRSLDQVSGPDQFKILADLRRLCHEADRESDRLIELELSVNPQLSFGQAAVNALARKRIVGQ